MTPPVAALLAGTPPHPRRIVCLTEETTETLYRIGAGDLVVGVSGFTVRPPEARRKPRVSSFLSADDDAIVALRPDLVIGFSDLQAEIAAMASPPAIMRARLTCRTATDAARNIPAIGRFPVPR